MTGGAIAADLDKSDSFRGYLVNYRGVVVRIRSACGQSRLQRRHY
jgi:hypothetical protein